MTKGKKSFKDISPADRLFDKAEQAANTQPADNADNVDNVENTHNPDNTATQRKKSTRAQFLIYPDVLDDIKKIAYMQRKSVNGLINELLEDYRQEHAADLEQYKAIYKEG